MNKLEVSPGAWGRAWKGALFEVGSQGNHKQNPVFGAPTPERPLQIGDLRSRCRPHKPAVDSLAGALEPRGPGAAIPFFHGQRGRWLPVESISSTPIPGTSFGRHLGEMCKSMVATNPGIGW